MKNIYAIHVSELEGTRINDSYSPSDKEPDFSGNMVAERSDRLTMIQVCCGEIIDGIHFCYDEEKWVNCGGHGGNKKEFILEEDEYLVALEWKSEYRSCYGGEVLAQVIIRTNKKEYSVKGTLMNRGYGKYSYVVEKDHEIIAIAGFGNTYLNRITKVYSRNMKPQFHDNDVYYDDYFSFINGARLTKIKGYSCMIVDKLQFVYDNDENMSQMHGQGVGHPFEFVFQENEHITKISIWVANCSYEEGYGPSKVMTRFKIETNKNRTFTTGLFGGDYGSCTQEQYDTFSHKHAYMFEAAEGEEIFGLAGIYSKYMGRPLAVYVRSNYGRRALEKGQRNSDGADILFINQMTKKDGGAVVVDSAVKPLVDAFYRFYNKLPETEKQRCKLIPEGKSLDNGQAALECIAEDVIQKALLTGQYRYISIRCHGSSSSCGNMYSQLFDWKWVRDNQKEIERKLKDTTINFFCCECGDRGSFTTGDISHNGLAREMIDAGVRAVFAYSVALASWENPEDNSTINGLMPRFVTNADRVMLDCLKKGKKPEDAARAILAEYDRMLKVLKTEGSLATDIISILTEKLPKELAVIEHVKKEAGLKKATEEDDFTKDGLVRTTQGLIDLRQAVKNKLLSLKHVPVTNYPLYKAYVDLCLNRAHFCGPGQSLPSIAPNLKADNQGELCADFGYDRSKKLERPKKKEEDPGTDL